MKSIYPILVGVSCGLITSYNAFAKKPNILIIVAVDMGYSDKGGYGSEIQTRNLDKLEHLAFVRLRRI